MLRSIRSKLMASYALIVFLCLLLAGLGALILIRRYQRNAVLNEHRATAAILSQRVQALFTAGTDWQDAEARLGQEARRLGVRVLLVADGGLILLDTHDEAALAGRRILFPIRELLDSRSSVVARRRLPDDGGQYFLIIVSLRPPAADTRLMTSDFPDYLIVAVPEQDVQAPWRQLATPLAIAASASLLLSIVIAAFLSRSITRPLAAMTEASERIARGKYEQAIPVQGSDEVARLAESFNRMALEVARSRQSQRDFLANVSHDLKTPLTSIRGFAQAVLEGAIHDEEGHRRAAQIINEEAERMAQLIQQLLDLARLDSSQAIEKRAPVALRPLVERCIAKFAPVAKESGVQLRATIAAPLPSVLGDETYLDQALSNLVDNAIKYTPAGGIVDIEARTLVSRAKGAKESFSPYAVAAGVRPRDGSWVALSVKDNGPGIAPEDLPRIFERFYRADKSRGTPRGSGLGLAIAKSITEAHGGSVEVTSQPGTGSCFTLLLPAD